MYTTATRTLQAIFCQHSSIYKTLCTKDYVFNLFNDENSSEAWDCQDSYLTKRSQRKGEELNDLYVY